MAAVANHREEQRSKTHEQGGIAMNTMRPSGKRIATGWSFSLGTIFGALATLGLFVSPGIHKSTADASLQSRPIAGGLAENAGASAIARSAAVIESHPVVQTAPDPFPGFEWSSEDILRKAPGHWELILQLD